MLPIIQFLILSTPVIIISRRNLLHPTSHGFYRFWGWEGIILLLVNNYHFWFVRPLDINQIFSWILLFWSVYLIVSGIMLLRKHGNASSTQRDDPRLYQFEKTTQLVETGIYRYIRHPLYASLIWLCWGIFLKQITLFTLVICLVTSLFFYITARKDELECIHFFGDKYRDYMKRSKMFFPYLF